MRRKREMFKIRSWKRKIEKEIIRIKRKGRIGKSEDIEKGIGSEIGIR